jgi:hypothetical protein
VGTTTYRSPGHAETLLRCATVCCAVAAAHHRHAARGQGPGLARAMRALAAAIDGVQPDAAAGPDGTPAPARLAGWWIQAHALSRSLVHGGLLGALDLVRPGPLRAGLEAAGAFFVGDAGSGQQSQGKSTATFPAALARAAVDYLSEMCAASSRAPLSTSVAAATGSGDGAAVTYRPGALLSQSRASRRARKWVWACPGAVALCMQIVAGGEAALV